MKVKEIERTANVAWSPAQQHPAYLAAGTAAQQLDATFSTSAALEIYSLNLSEDGMSMPCIGEMPSEFRFHKLVWGTYGMTEGDRPAGVLVGGADKGQVFVWDAAKLIQKTDSLIYKLEKHTGGVAALDINPFQSNLLASGASDSEIFIWDLNNPSNPMTPGVKSQPPDDVTCLAWNQQVQHILASAYAGRCVVWDLRKNEPIIKVSDSMSRIKSKLLAWHPEVATQLCLASEDDHTPVIQLWDLRFATSPLKSLENHTRGILSVAWCPQDPDLLLSCGKDNRILCWNPNSSMQNGEVVYELPTTNQWSFDVQWCPRNPAVISSAAFDGHISIYSLMGGGGVPVTPTDKIAESFPGDPFSQHNIQQTTTQQPAVVALKNPPKWLRRPVGASFGFGGKLITFESAKPAGSQQQPHQTQTPGTARQVHISQVVTEPVLISRSNQLETAISNSQFAEFCALKIANSKSSVDENIWSFLKVNFEKEPRSKFLQLLGYDENNLSAKMSEASGETAPPKLSGVDANELAEKMAALTSGDFLAVDQERLSGATSPYVGSQTPGESEGTSASEGMAAFDQIASHPPDSRPDSPFPIAVDNDVDGIITQAILMANFEVAVEMCIQNGRMAEAIILAIAGGPELLARTQKSYFRKNKSNITRLISSVVTRDFEHIVRTCCLDNWREALAVALTYAKAEEFSQLCEIMGSRLETERHGELSIHACLCYICAGNVERLVECWTKNIKQENEPESLQDLVEMVMVLRKAVELAQNTNVDFRSGLLVEKLSHYAELLAAQGSLNTALNYLGSSNETSLLTLRDRMYQALGQAVAGTAQPPCPFQKVNILPEGVQAQPVAAASVADQSRQRTVSSGSHQSQARGQFVTTTTPSSTYYTQPHYGGSDMNNGPAASAMYGQGSYAQPTSQPPYSQPTPAPASKGPLSHKYPSYPATSSYDQYSQPNTYGGYGQDSYTAPYSSGYSGMASQSPVSQPNIYTPAQPTPGSAPQPNIYTPNLTSSSRPAPNIYSPSPVTPNQGSQNAAMPPHMPSSQHASYQESRPSGAWNDPPPLQEKKRPTTNSYQAPAPITTPLFGVPQPEQTPPGAPNYAGMGSQIYNPQEYQQPPQQHQQKQVEQRKPEPPKPKGPIPAEHQVIQEIFETIANQCLTRATNPQMKRKLEDVLRKLEILYDKLRENKLSSSVTLGLHQIIQAVQQYDYQTGLAYHTQLISHGNFSEISSFMPGIKTLMQVAAQLQVYAQ